MDNANHEAPGALIGPPKRAAIAEQSAALLIVRRRKPRSWRGIAGAPIQGSGNGRLPRGPRV